MSVTVDSVKAELASEDYGDRLLAVNKLRQLDPAIAFELLQGAIADPNARVRYAAVSQMSSLGTQNRALSLDILLHCLNHDPEMDVKGAAADSLGALKLREAFADLQTLYETSREWILQFSILAALGELGEPQAFDMLAAALQSDQELLKLAAVGSLGELGDSRAVPLLAGLATDPDWQVRHRLCLALQRLGGEAAQSLLTQLAQDPVPQVAAAARETLP